MTIGTIRIEFSELHIHVHVHDMVDNKQVVDSLKKQTEDITAASDQLQDAIKGENE